MKIVQVGGGTAGWLNALAMTSNIDNIDFTIIENEEPISVGEATFINLISFHSFLDINEHDFMRECNSTFKFAVKFKDFHEKNHSHYHPFLFEAFYEDFLDENKIPDYGILASKYGYHLESNRYQKFLKNNIPINYTHIKDTVTQVKINDNGIEYIKLENSETPIYADLFIDCTGFKHKLIKELGANWISINNALPNNTAIVHRRNYGNNIIKEMHPFTEAKGMNYGWMWTIPLWNKKSHGYVFSDAYTSVNDAELEFRQNLKLKDNDECRIVKFKNGHLDKPWIKNCVAIGLSSSFVEPLESTGIALITESIVNVIAALSKGYIKQVDRDKYAYIINRDVSRIKDFLTFHFIHTKREDTIYWKDWKYNKSVEDIKFYNLVTSKKIKEGDINRTDSLFFPDIGFEYISTKHHAHASNNYFMLKYYDSLAHFENAKTGQMQINPIEPRTSALSTFQKHLDEEHGIKDKLLTAEYHYDYVKKIHERV